MKKYYKYFAYAVAALYFFLGIFVFTSPHINLPKTVKVIFAVFLFLYGAFRLARIWSKSREEGDE
jgi:uncharacterized membrane protein HdeD (DUF308 family)